MGIYNLFLKYTYDFDCPYYMFKYVFMNVKIEQTWKIRRMRRSWVRVDLSGNGKIVRHDSLDVVS